MTQKTIGPILLIFDVDGTLLTNGKVAKNAFLDAFSHVTGAAEPDGTVGFAGHTDRGIFRSLIQRNEVEGDPDELFPRFAHEFARLLRQRYPESPDPRLLPGIETLIPMLADDRRFTLSLGTGNYRETSYIKLGRFGLDRYFPAGGFGGDYEHRGDVIRAAIREARDKLGWEGDSSSAWVIGDTPRDVIAARDAGTRALAVATGFSSHEELVAAKADALLENLADSRRFLEIVGA